MLQGIRNSLHRISFALLPSCCVLCGDKGADFRDLCRPCEHHLPWNRVCCELCALPLHQPGICGHCIANPPAFQRCVAPLRYGFPVAQLINGFKHRHNLSYGAVLAGLLANQISNRHSDQLPDMIIPVPLHWRRQFVRGFNQATWIGGQLASRLSVPLAPNSVSRVQATPAQQGLSRKSRRNNLRGAFKVNGDIAGMSIAVVDDVVTTGSTIAALTESLLAAGASAVQIWCLARTPEEN